jgi:hypothetical protein
MWSGRLALAGRVAIPVVCQLQVSASVLVERQFSPWKIVFKQFSFNLISQGLHHPSWKFLAFLNVLYKGCYVHIILSSDANLVAFTGVASNLSLLCSN